MNLRILGVAFCVSLLGCAGQAGSEAIRLADAVVVRTLPSDREAAALLTDAVTDLTNVIFRKTGHLAPVCDKPPADAKSAIYLGEAAIAESRTDVSSLRLGDWRVKAEAGKVFLIGRTARSANAAMVEFAARFCDYRFITVDDCDPCAVDPDLAVPVCDVTVRPAIYVRDLYHGANYSGRTAPEVHGAWRAYSRRRRQVSPRDVEPSYRVSRQVRACHSTFEYLPPAKWFKEHPEYYSMREDGKRYAIEQSRSQLCYSNREALDRVYEALLGFVKADRAKNPTNYPCIYDFSQQDNSDFLCHCPDCKKVIAKYNRVPGGHKEGGDAGLQLEFVNELARRIRKVYPDVQLRVFAYVSTECPPKEGTIVPEPNVVIWWCDVYSYSDHTLPLETPGHYNMKQAEELDGWLRLTKNVQLWDYMLYDRSYPEVSADALAADAKFFRDRSLPFVFMENEYAYQPFYELNHYLMSELYIDPDADLERLIGDYCRIYGPAADEMRAAIGFLRKIERTAPAATSADWHGRNLPWLTAANLDELIRLLGQAWKKSEGRVARSRLANILASAYKAEIAIFRKDPKAADRLAAAIDGYRRCGRFFAKTGFMGESERTKAAEKVDEDIEMLTLSFKDLPPELVDVPKDELVCIDHHADSPYKSVPDAKSERGRAFVTKEGEKFTGLPVACGVYDSATKDSFGFRLTDKDVRPGEGYRWVRLGRVHVGSRTFFWFPGSWQSSVKLGAYHILADGLAVDPNWYEMWISVRVEGPAFASGSSGKDRMLIDRMVLRRLR